MRYPRVPIVTGLLLAAALLLPSGAQSTDDPTTEARAALGKRLFEDRNFTNPAADYGSSCAECHSSKADVKGRAPRFFADYTPTSLTATKETTTRNTPTLLDAGEMEAFGWDGATTDLEQLVFEKLTGPLLGWSAEDRQRALEAIHFTLLNEGTGGGPGESFVAAFASAYGVDLETLGVEAAVRQGARAIADYVRTIRSTGTAPWDAFVSMNRFHPGPIHGEDAESYAYGVFSRIGNQEGRGLIKRPQGFTRAAYRGFKIFFRTFQEEEGEPVGACVLCHTPPSFTDHRFHVTGTAALAYDAVHGEGGFAALELPESPSVNTAARPNVDDPAAMDLGRFNHTGDPADRGAFKTPTLRNIARTDPYMHDGGYATLEDAVRSKMLVADAARAGTLAGIDPACGKIHLTEADVASLVAFLQQLNEVGEERFREYLIHLADD